MPWAGASGNRNGLTRIGSGRPSGATGRIGKARSAVYLVDAIVIHGVGSRFELRETEIDALIRKGLLQNRNAQQSRRRFGINLCLSRPNVRPKTVTQKYAEEFSNDTPKKGRPTVSSTLVELAPALQDQGCK